MLSFYLLLINDDADKALFEKLYYENRNAMMACARGILKAQDDAEDALQDAFLAIAFSFEKVKKIAEDRMKYYYLTVVKNAAIDIYNKRQKHANTINIDDYKDVEDESALEEYLVEENLGMIVDAIKAMNQVYRDVLYFNLVCDLSVTEISKMLGRKPDTVKKQLSRGKAMLIQLLKRSDAV